MDNHIRPVVSVDISKTECYRHQVLSRSKQLWPKIDTGLRAITARELDDFDTAIQIDGDKMARVCCAVVMSHHCIYLECAWATIMDIVHRGIPPANHGCQQRPEGKHSNHSHTQVEQRMRAVGKFLFACRSFWHWHLGKTFWSSRDMPRRGLCTSILCIIIHPMPFAHLFITFCLLRPVSRGTLRNRWHRRNSRFLPMRIRIFCDRTVAQNTFGVYFAG